MAEHARRTSGDEAGAIATTGWVAAAPVVAPAPALSAVETASAGAGTAGANDGSRTYHSRGCRERSPILLPCQPPRLLPSERPINTGVASPSGQIMLARPPR